MGDPKEAQKARTKRPQMKMKSELNENKKKVISDPGPKSKLLKQPHLWKDVKNSFALLDVNSH